MAPTSTDYPTTLDPFDRARLDRGAEETWWRAAWVGESTAFERRMHADAKRREADWHTPKRVAS